MKHWKSILAIIVNLGLALALLPISITGTNGIVTVGIDAPTEVDPGSSFVADVTVDWVTDFNACGFDVTYDRTVITVTDVTDGEIDGHPIQVDEWHYFPASSPRDTGRIRVLALVSGAPAPGVTGTGRIARIHFTVVGSPTQSSAIHLVGVGMYDYLANLIPATTVDDSVYVAQPPATITTATLPEGSVGSVYTATLAATGGKAPYTWTATGLPTGLTCSRSGVISGTPTVSGNFSVTVTATDSFSPPSVVSKVLSLNVYLALVITAASPLPEGEVGDAYPATTLAATGGKTPLSWTVTGLPAGLTCSTAGVILGTPTAAGTFSVKATVTDSFSPPKTASKFLNLKVYPALNITTASPLPDGKVGQVYRGTTLAATGGKTPYTWTTTGLPAGLTCSALGVISGTPTVGGQFSVNATVADSFSPAKTVSRILSLYVSAPLGVATASLSEGDVGAAYAVTLMATGGKTPYSWTATGLPAGLTCSAGGVISGTPTASGNFSVTATVTDSSSPVNVVSKVLSLKVYPALGITTTSPLPGGKVGDAYTVTTLVATGGKTPYTWTATGLPAGLTCSTAGVISGTPVEEVGGFTVTVTVSDSLSQPSIISKNLSITISSKLGDSNMDGVVDTGDITKVKRIYFGLDAPTPGADVNGDEMINAGDITAIKIIYFS